VENYVCKNVIGQLHDSAELTLCDKAFIPRLSVGWVSGRCDVAENKNNLYPCRELKPRRPTVRNGLQ
jgi:hypothetical protein